MDIEQSGLNDLLKNELRTLSEKYGLERLILFGSRARGDFKKTSDIDLAVQGGNFAEFALDADETTTTLLKFDFVNLDGAVQEELLNSIKREGIVLYKKVADQKE